MEIDKVILDIEIKVREKAAELKEKGYAPGQIKKELRELMADYLTFDYSEDEYDKNMGPIEESETRLKEVNPVNLEKWQR